MRNEMLPVITLSSPVRHTRPGDAAAIFCLGLIELTDGSCNYYECEAY